MPKDSPVVAAQRQSKKRQKFVELAERRTVNAIKAIRIIGKLGNRSHYEFDEADVRKIVQVLTRELDALRSRMLTTGARETIDFKL
jgi:hypothetical protein